MFEKIKDGMAERNSSTIFRETSGDVISDILQEIFGLVCGGIM